MLTKELIQKKHPGKKLEKMKYLNIWGEDIENIDIISEMKGLKLISLSANKISSLKPFENLVHLKELYLRQNNISDISEINYLSNCQGLKSLWLIGNPICKNKDEFLKIIIEKLPNLAFLDNKPIAEIKKDLDNKNYVIDENIILEDKKEVEKENDIVCQGEITKNNFYINNNKENEKNETEKENENNIVEDNNNKEKDKDKNNDLLDDLLYNGNENNDKKEDENKNELKQTKNKLLVSTVDKLNDILLDNDREESTNINEDKSNNLNDKTNLLDSKSDIFKTGFSYKKNADESKENKQNQNDSNNNDNNDNNDLINGKDIHNPLRIASFKEENNELLNNILKNVDTSQSFIRKTNTNKTIKITPNMVEINENNNLNNNMNNINDNINDNKDNNNNNIINTNNNDENNFTKNLNDMVKNANMNISSQSFRFGKNTGISNILNNINTSQTMPRKIENNVSNILREINSSQTMNKRKEQQVNDILKDIETTTTNLGKAKIDINHINNLEKNNANDKFQSIDDIKKMFNNDYPRNNDNNNLYGNNNIKDTRINEIFKNEQISSDSMLPINNKEKGPVKLEYNNNFINKNYEYDYGKRPETDNGQNDERDENNKNYNLNPKHENKINAIINLLEDLNLENLLHIKNQIVKMMKSNK